MFREIETLPDNVRLADIASRRCTVRRPKHHGVVAGRIRDRFGDWVAYHSALERDFALLMVMRPATERVVDQPVTIRYRIGAGRLRWYSPDYLVFSRTNDPVLAEIHPERPATDRDRIRSVVATAWSASHGCRYEVWTDRDIHTTEFANAVLLAPYRVIKANPVVERWLLERCSSPIRLRQLLGAQCGQVTCWRTLLWMLATHRLWFNRSEQLCEDSVICATPPLRGSTTVGGAQYDGS